VIILRSLPRRTALTVTAQKIPDNLEKESD